MSSSSALKHNISVNTSIYGGVFIFAVYSIIPFYLLIVFQPFWLSLTYSLPLFTLAYLSARKTYKLCYQLKVNELSEVELKYSRGKLIQATISKVSIYNRFCIYLVLEEKNMLIGQAKAKRKSIVIYRDAVSEANYRLLARLINTGQ